MADETIPTPRKPGSSRPVAVWQPPAPEELQSQIPQYKVLGLLGRGGMGAVYKGWQVSLDRCVAIKILPPDVDDGDAHFAARFKQEAKTMARFMHPAIVAVFDAGETTSGLLYIVMEFVEGTDVAQMVKSNGRLPPEKALSITAHVCDALHYAHTHGVIHRDIKPANIMVNHEGQVKVADFGLAKANEAAYHGLTRTDMSMGTPDYIAPEALMLGVVADHRADLYAVGVMLYNMLTGDIPRGKFKMPSQKVGTDPRFDAIVDKAMEQERDQRYQSAKEIRRDLDVILTTPIEKAPPPTDDSLPTLPLPKGPTGIPAPQQVMKEPLQDTKAALQKLPPKKYSTGMIAGALAVIGLGAFFGLKKPAVNPSGGSAVSSTPATATKDAPFVNSLGMNFVPVPGTQVLFSVWDTRVADYAAYTAANPKVDDSWTKQNAYGVPVSREPEYPVVGVSWDDAQAFCQWLTEKESAEGRLPKGLEYRLPTDEEWSWAVGLPPELGTTPKEKAGKNGVDFPWGKDWPPAKKAGNYADEMFHAKFPNWVTDGKKDRPWIAGYTDDYATTSPVGSFPANAHGLHDMGGNVWQWCEDWYDKDQKNRVLRGSAWDRNERSLAVSSARNDRPPGKSGSDVGFRCVLAPAVSTPPAAAPVQAVSDTPATATKDAPFVNSLGMKFVPVPGTKVLFCIHDTRKGDYRQYPNADSRVNDQWKAATVGGLPLGEGDDCPVVNVSWEDAEGFCVWLGKKEGRSYRLPTDREWSVAVGIGDREAAEGSPQSKDVKVRGAFPWGAAWPPPAGAGNFADRTLKEKKPSQPILEGYEDGYATTAPVMRFAPNELGLFDMAGNVSQWCEDNLNSTEDKKVLRGSSWSSYSHDGLLSSARGGYSPSTRGSLYGFRVVLLLGEVTKATAPSSATKEHPFINSLGMNFVPVPMVNGPTAGQRVLFSIWDTRVRDYAEFVKETGRELKPGFDEDPTCPKVNVSWEDAQLFCQWLTARERAAGRLPSAFGYRLPSDHEWSCAVGIGAKEDPTQLPREKDQKVGDVFPWGTQWPPPQGAGNFAGEELRPLLAKGVWPSIKEVIAGYDDGFVYTSPVGSFAANQFGLFDMAGNVSQWCEDWLDKDQKKRVLRGSSWGQGFRFSLCSSARNNREPDARDAVIGFRCVLAPANSTPQP